MLRCLLVLLAMGMGISAADWPSFRGPTHDGISSETRWQSTWPADGPPVAWKAEVGMGFSNIVVADRRAATAGYADGEDSVSCFSAISGKRLWKYSYAAELGDKYYEGGTTGTPTFDGNRLYWLSRWGELICFEAESGKIQWQISIQKEIGAPNPLWGYTGAPLVQGDLLILNVGDAGAAVNKATGQVVWKSAAKDCGYSTPFPVTVDGKALVVLANTDSYVAVETATGAEVWRQRWLTQYNVLAANPVMRGDQMFISTGYGKGGGLFQLGKAAPTPIWKTKALRTQLNAAVLHDGYLYGADGDTTEKPALKCLEFATGKEMWSEPGFGSGGVVIADGQLITLNSAGELLIAPASSDGFKPVTRAQVLAPRCWTVPVLANGLIYGRNFRGEIVALDVRGKP